MQAQAILVPGTSSAATYFRSRTCHRSGLQTDSILQVHHNTSIWKLRKVGLHSVSLLRYVSILNILLQPSEFTVNSWLPESESSDAANATVVHMPDARLTSKLHQKARAPKKKEQDPCTGRTQNRGSHIPYTTASPHRPGKSPW